MIQNSLNRNRTLYALISGIILLLGLMPARSRAQATLGAREIALGQATTALPNSEWSVFENVAMISDKQSTVSFYGIQYYGLSELTDIAAVVTMPTSVGVIGGGVHRYGNDMFNKTRIRLAFKNSFQKFHYGIAINYNHVAQGGSYGSVGAIGIDIGISALIIDDLWIGAKATNINQPKYGEVNDIDENLPRDLSIGLSYRLSGVALFTTDVVKDVDFPISYRGGVEVNVIDQLTGRVGITTKPQTFSAGFGYNTKQWGVNIAVQRHEEEALGYSPGVDFNISW